jgi:hypothetical protein
MTGKVLVNKDRELLCWCLTHVGRHQVMNLPTRTAVRSLPANAYAASPFYDSRLGSPPLNEPLCVAFAQCGKTQMRYVTLSEEAERAGIEVWKRSRPAG